MALTPANMRQTLNYRPGVGLDYDDMHSEKTVRENKNDPADDYAKPPKPEVSIYKFPFREPNL